MYSRTDIYRLASETGAHPRTVTKWLRGNTNIHPTTDYALRAACEKLEIRPPVREEEEEAKQGAA